MAKYLVIVESPAKVKTVKKYLGANYEVAASMGHVRDLPKSRLGIDVEHDFESPSAEKESFWHLFEKPQKKQIKFISQLTLTARERQFPGICRLR